MQSLTPKTLAELAQALSAATEKAKIIAGGTDFIIKERAGKFAPDLLIYPSFIPELNTITKENGVLRIGAAVPMNGITAALKDDKAFCAIADAASDVGSPQIRAKGTMAGNLCNASPAGDMLPVSWLYDAQLELMNAEKIIENLNYAYGALTQGADVLSALRQAQSAIYKANDMVDGKYSDIIDALEQAMIEADEAVNQIENASSNVAVDTGELEELESRLFALRGLARKHQVEIDALPRVLTELKQKLSNIEFGEEGLIKLRKEEDAAKLDYVKAANELSQARQQTAAKLDAAVMQELPPLKMEKAKFITQIAKQEESLWGEGGFDTVTFTVATNPNSPQGPINKIASGGELARFMLALKVNLAQSSSVETMIFDEVDAGVGGATAQAVGERLSRLAQGVQVLVVTHSPQVAAKGNNHFKVEKNTVDNVTTTNVRELPADEKCEEIARMLAGERISDEARAAAKVLLSA